MEYLELSDELREKLENGRVCYARYSAAADKPDNLVDDAILVAKNSPMDLNKLEGYVEAPVKVWFDYVKKDRPNEEMIRMVSETLGVFDA